MKILSKKRRREFKTDYLRRKRLLESGKPRVVIRKTNRYINLQYVESKAAQDRVMAAVSSKKLLGYGWPKERTGSLKSLAACYLTGLLFGKKIIKEKAKEAILDSGLIESTHGSRIYAALKGIIDAGLNVRHSQKMFPEENRIKNEKTADFFENVKSKIRGK